MPLFTYICDDCQATSEVLVRNGQAPICPKCESSRLVKQASAFAPMHAAAAASPAPTACGTQSCCMGGPSCPFN